MSQLTKSFQQKNSWALLDGISERSVPVRTGVVGVAPCACAAAGGWIKEGMDS